MPKYKFSNKRTLDIDFSVNGLTRFQPEIKYKKWTMDLKDLGSNPAKS